MRPGTTKAFTMTADAWVRIASLYDLVNGPEIKEGDSCADGALSSVITKAMQYAWSETTPTSAGHPMAAGDSLSGSHRNFIKNLWVKNDAAGQHGTIIITPYFSL